MESSFSTSQSQTVREIPGLGYPNDVFVTVPGIQAARLWLTPEETRLFGLVGQGVRLIDFIERSGLDDIRTYELVRALRRKGAIIPLRELKTPVTVVDALHEPDVDLDVERRKDILSLEKLLDTLNYYQLFGVQPTSSLEEIKRACFERSSWYHPDKYFGRKLGSFKPRLDKIFRRLKVAQAVLLDAEQREAYNQQMGISGAPTVAPGALGGPSEAVAPSERDEERRKRFSRHPYLRHQMNKRVQAENAARREAAKSATASGSKPWPTMQSEADRAAQAALLQEDIRKATEAEAIGALNEAARCWQSASNRDPIRLELALKAGFVGLAAGQEPRSVRFWAQRAVELQFDSVDAHLLMGKVLLAAGSRVLAEKSFERVLELEPDHEEARQLMRKKKSFWSI